jgi:exodeoxyribonuclease V gamma subunit
MLTIHHSNRMERLIATLALNLAEPATDAWLEPEVVVVQSRGMERFVAMGLANVLGISANVVNPFPASLVWDAYRAVLPDLPERSSYDKDVMTWRILALFDDLGEAEGLAPLRGYLDRAANETERFDLARRIADVFDQYLVYRPDWINRWEAGHDGHWQAVLWRRLTAGVGGHRASLQRAFIEKLGNLNQAPAGLPARLSLLGISSLPEAYLDTLRQLARFCRVDLYLLNPCREYWGMIQAEQAIARFCGDDGTAAEELYLETGNRLLASLGRQGRDLHHLLAELDAASEEQFEDPPQDSLLHCLQADILNLRNRGGNSTYCDLDNCTVDIPATPMDTDDRSVQVHVCHSALREVEVLYDQLLALFERYPDLRASDVIVMTPDIDAYAPAVRAVFSTADPHIPFGIADRSLAVESPVVDVFLQLLSLVDSRFDVDRVLALLAVMAVRQRFAIAEEDLPLIGNWLRETAVRWGIDAAGRAALDLPATREHTWTAGLERLLLGYALPADERRLYAHILPYDPVEGEGARIMGRLQRFTRQLFVLDQLLDGAKTLSEWCETLLQVLDDFIAIDDVFEPERNAVRDALDVLVDSAAAGGFQQPVALPVVRAWLKRQLGGGSSVSGFLGGGVTFCAMVPMRSIPFRVICLIGLNDGVYPRPERPLDFDLMAKQPRRGDRSRRLDDRYLFLEAMVSVRDVLYLSYVGRSIRDNSIIPPSPLVSELLDYLRQGFYRQDQREGSALDQVVVDHPLQAFSQAYFLGGDNLFSYSDRLCEAARRAGRGQSDGEPLLSEPLPEPESAYRELDFQQLVRFFQNPARYFLRERLQIRLETQEEALGSHEPFLLEPFADRAIRQRLLARQLEGLGPGDILPLVRAGGLLPHGTIGDVLYGQEVGKLKPLLQALGEAPRTPGPKPEVDLPVGEFRLTGWLPNVTAEGLLDYAVESLSARHYLELWVRHLILNYIKPQGCGLISTWLGLGDGVVLRPVERAEDYLLELLTLYWRGLQMPLAFFPRSALVYAQAEREHKSDPLLKAKSCWEGSEHHWGEGMEVYYQLAFRHRPAIGEEFASLARQVFMPLLAHAEGKA